MVLNTASQSSGSLTENVSAVVCATFSSKMKGNDGSIIIDRTGKNIQRFQRQLFTACL